MATVRKTVGRASGWWRVDLKKLDVDLGRLA